MDIVEALGGEGWFNIYAALHLCCLIVIAACQVVRVLKEFFG